MAKVSAEKKLETIKEQRRKTKNKGFAIIIASSLLLFFFLWIILRNLLIAGIGSIVGTSIIFLFLIYFIFAPVKVFGYFVKQSRCLLIMEGEGYKRSDLQLADHTLTEKGWVVPLGGKSIPEKFGIDHGKKIKGRISFHNLKGRISFHNLKFFELLGLFEKPFEDIFKWEKFNGNTGDITDEEDVISDWVVVPYNYGLRIRDIYSKDNIPISFNMGILAQPLNPSFSQFGIKNWYKAFMAEIHNIVFEEIRSSSYNDLQGEIQELAEHFYKRFAKEEQDKQEQKIRDSVIETCLKKYGMYIIKIQIGKLSVPKAILDAAEAPVKQEFEKRAVHVEAEMNRDRTVTELSAADILFQRRTGITSEDFVQLLEDPDEFERVYGSMYDKCRRDTLDGMAIKKGTGVRIFNEGIGAGGSDIVNAAALFQRMSNNAPPQQEKKKKDPVENNGDKRGRAKNEEARETLRGLGYKEDQL